MIGKKYFFDLLKRPAYLPLAQRPFSKKISRDYKPKSGDSFNPFNVKLGKTDDQAPKAPSVIGKLKSFFSRGKDESQNAQKN